MKLVFLILALFICIHTNAQIDPTFRCPSDLMHRKELLSNQSYADQFTKFESIYRNKYKSKLNGKAQVRNNPPTYRIPVVVHVLHDCAPYGSPANPTDERIKEIIKESSDRFRHTSGLVFGNPFSGVDTEIELCLASADPQGRYTSGIVRYHDPIYASYPNDPDIDDEYTNLINPLEAIKWPTEQYYNLFVVTDLPDASGVYLGSIDGTIFTSTAFWSGLICHETGHYLSLSHPFEGGCPNNDCLTDNDRVCDTPPKSEPGTLGNPCGMPGNSCATDGDDTSVNNPYRSVAMGGNGDKPDLIENYMDYTGGCWEAFTQGQALRMRTYIETNRLTLINNATKCDQVLANNLDLGVTSISDNYRTCDIMYTAQVDVKNYGTQTVNNFSIIIEVNGVPVLDKTLNVTINPDEIVTVDLDPISLPPGKNLIRIKTNIPNGAPDNYSNNDDQCIYRIHQNQGSLLPFFEDFSACNFEESYTFESGQNVDWTVASDADLNNCQNCFAAITGSAPSNEKATLTLPLLDFTNYQNPILSFDIGYLPRYDFIVNELEVEVSAECQTAQKVFSAASINLATNTPPAHTDGVFMIPTCDQIKNIEIDLVQFGGMDNILISFSGFGRWFSPLLLDNIQVIENTSACNPDANGVIRVTNNNNQGAGSLREAIDCANNTPGLNHIEFNIIGTNFTIQLESPLPATTDHDGLTIDGTTQNGNVGTVVINCSQIPNPDNGVIALHIQSNNTEISGLHFVGLGGVPTQNAVITYLEIGDNLQPVENILIGGMDKGNIFSDMHGGNGSNISAVCGLKITNGNDVDVQANIFGVNDQLDQVSNLCDYCVGIYAAPSNRGVIVIGGSGNDQGNIVGGWYEGILLRGIDAQYEVFGNFVGTDPSMSFDLGNQEIGIDISGGNAQVGGTILSQRNICAYNNSGIGFFGINTVAEGNELFLNSSNGITIGFTGTDPTENQNHLIANNHIYQNGSGISLFNSVSNIIITGNEINDNDLVGINSLNHPTQPAVPGQLYTLNSLYCNGIGIVNLSEGLIAPLEPVIDNATFSNIQGTAIANGRVEIFLHLECPGAACQGFEYLGETVADGTGNWSFFFPSMMSAGAQLTATVTDANNTTSEFSACYKLCGVAEFELGGNTVLCAGESLVLNIGNPGPVIQWSTGETDSSITISEGGVYSVTVSDGSDGCELADTIEIVVDDVIALAMTTDSFGCAADTITLDASGSSITDFISWETIDGHIVNDPSSIQIQVDQPGTYILNINHPNEACRDADTIVLAANNGLPPLDIMSDAGVLPCGPSMIQLMGLFDYSNMVNVQWVNQNNDPLGNELDLFVSEPGNYTLNITDILSGCVVSNSILITRDTALVDYSVDLGPDVNINRGDSVEITFQTDISPDSIASIIWNVSPCLDCESIMLSPLEDILITVQIIDHLGCTAISEKWVRIQEPQVEYFAPNIFSPNGDQLNDYFTIFTQSTITEIKELSIFDRFGSLVFRTQNIPPNQLNLGWDGTQKGKAMDNGVFVYKAILVQHDQQEIIISGDITLVK